MNCILCESPDNLNTAMHVSETDVRLCDGCSENATVGMVKEALAKREEVMEALKAQAAAMGLKLVDEATTSGSRIIQYQKDDRALAKEQSEAPKKKGRTKDLPPVKRVSGSEAAAYASHSLPNAVQNKDGTYVEAPETYNQEFGKFTDSKGREIPIPMLKEDATGTTKINVVRFTDAELQYRFKQQGERSQHPDLAFDNSPLACLDCNGSGFKDHTNTAVCVSCGGSGMV